jgi:hypothetical protein
MPLNVLTLFVLPEPFPIFFCSSYLIIKFPLITYMFALIVSSPAMNNKSSGLMPHASAYKLLFLAFFAFMRPFPVLTSSWANIPLTP